MAGAGPHDLHDIKAVDKLTKLELIRACRLAIAAELDASNLYEMIAEQSESKLTKEIFQEVADEEKVHAGEFIKLLSLLDPEEVQVHHKKGAQEVTQHTQSAVPQSDNQVPEPEEPQEGDIPGYVADIRPRSPREQLSFEEINDEIERLIAEEQEK